MGCIAFVDVATESLGKLLMPQPLCMLDRPQVGLSAVIHRFRFMLTAKPGAKIIESVSALSRIALGCVYLTL